MSRNFVITYSNQRENTLEMTYKSYNRQLCNIVTVKKKKKS